MLLSASRKKTLKSFYSLCSSSDEVTQQIFASHATTDESPKVVLRILLLELACSLPNLYRLSVCFLLMTVVPNAIRAQGKETVLSVVNDKTITQQQVDEVLVSQLFPLQQQIYALRKSALENLITRAVLETEAHKRGITVDELRKQLTDGPAKVARSEVEDLYLENASAFGAMSPDEALEKVRLDLEAQARLKNYREALAKLRESSNVKLFFEEPRLPVGIPGESEAVIGAKNAAVTIVEFSDFECRYCIRSQSTIKEVLQSFGQEVRLVFRHLPLEIHAQAFPSARAAFCAGQQGRFWQYHDALFAWDQLSPGTFKNIATELRLDMAKFQECLVSDVSRSAVRKDMEEARRLGINSTPTFIINGKLVRGAIPFAEFKSIIERELKSANGGASKE